MAVKTKPKTQAKAKSVVSEKPKRVVQARSKTKVAEGSKPATKSKTGGTTKVRVVNRISPPHILTKAEQRRLIKGSRLAQFAYMKAPGLVHIFEVGDIVEVYGDHEKNKERIRGWIGGTVVQVDNKMVAVQFRSNVFLTDGWMVPDRILWFPLNSEHIRPVLGKKSSKREKAIPEY